VVASETYKAQSSLHTDLRISFSTVVPMRCEQKATRISAAQIPQRRCKDGKVTRSTRQHTTNSETKETINGENLEWYVSLIVMMHAPRMAFLSMAISPALSQVGWYIAVHSNKAIDWGVPPFTPFKVVQGNLIMIAVMRV
jgi:hypothetical protein